MNLEQIKQLLDLTKDYDLKSFKVGDIEIQFAEKKGPTQFINLGVKADKMPTEDELLFMSSEGLPDKADEEK